MLRDTRKSLPIWGEFYNRHDIPHICFTPLWRNDLGYPVPVLRSAGEGVIG